MNRAKKYTAHGRSLTIRQWARLTGVAYDTLRTRIKRRGWSIDRAIPARPWALDTEREPATVLPKG